MKVRPDHRSSPLPGLQERGFSWGEEQGFFPWLWPRLGPSLAFSVRLRWFGPVGTMSELYPRPCGCRGVGVGVGGFTVFFKSTCLYCGGSACSIGESPREPEILAGLGLGLAHPWPATLMPAGWPPFSVLACFISLWVQAEGPGPGAAPPPVSTSYPPELSYDV